LVNVASTIALRPSGYEELACLLAERFPAVSSQSF